MVGTGDRVPPRYHTRMHSIHPTAIVSKECELGEGVEIGPHCVVSGRVKLGSGVRLIASVCLSGPLVVGDGATFYPFSCVGYPGQDFKFKPGDPTAGVIIGKNTVLREYATVHAATKLDQPTRVGDSVLMMVCTHVGHDAHLDNRAILVNGAALGGHSYVGEAATLSANVGLHQFGRVGRLAFVSASVAVSSDVPPFCLVAQRTHMNGLNIIGLRRSGMPRDQITELREVYRDAFRNFHTREDLLRLLEERGRNCPPVAEWHRFVVDKKRSIMMGFDRSNEPEEAGLSD